MEGHVFNLVLLQVLCIIRLRGDRVLIRCIIQIVNEILGHSLQGACSNRTLRLVHDGS